MPKIIMPAALIMMFFMVPGANARLIAIDWTGSVTRAELPGVVGAGESVQGRIVYDTSAPVSAAGTDYATYSTHHSTQLHLAGASVTGVEGTITISNDQLVCPTRSCFILDSISVSSSDFTGDSVGGYAVESFFLGLEDFSNTVVSGTALPSGPGDVNTSNLGEGFSLGFVQLADNGGMIDLSIDSVSVSNVPLPAAAWLLGSAIVGLGAIKRRKSA